MASVLFPRNRKALICLLCFVELSMLLFFSNDWDGGFLRKCARPSPNTSWPSCRTGKARARFHIQRLEGFFFLFLYVASTIFFRGGRGDLSRRGLFNFFCFLKCGLRIFGGQGGLSFFMAFRGWNTEFSFSFTLLGFQGTNFVAQLYNCVGEAAVCFGLLRLSTSQSQQVSTLWTP